MRILLVADAESPHTRRWASALADEGHDVLLAGFGGPRLAGVEQVRLGHGHGRSRYLRAVPKLRRVIAGFAPQVVNAHFVSSYGVMANLTGSGVPLLLTAWGSDVLWLPFRPGWHRDLTTSALVNASLITYDSEDVGSLLRSQHEFGERIGADVQAQESFQKRGEQKHASSFQLFLVERDGRLHAAAEEGGAGLFELADDAAAGHADDAVGRLNREAR